MLYNVQAISGASSVVSVSVERYGFGIASFALSTAQSVDTMKQIIVGAITAVGVVDEVEIWVDIEVALETLYKAKHDAPEGASTFSKRVISGDFDIWVEIAF